MVTKIIKKCYVEKPFEPITVEITANSFEEAMLLFHIFNHGSIGEKFNNGDIGCYNKDHSYSNCATSFSSSIFQDIESELRRQGYSIIK
jgi:hypothetical protein